MSHRVLLITPVFYGLEINIKRELEKSGYDVVWIENKELKGDYHGTDTKFKLFRKIWFFLFSPAGRYIKAQLKKIENRRFDVLFAVNGHSLCPTLHKILKVNNPDIYSVLYLWDSFEMYNWSEELKFFKRVITFDRKDSEEFNLEYKPNFFVQRTEKHSQTAKYDLLFIGKFSPSRYHILKDLENEFKELGLICFIGLFPAYNKLFHNKLLYNILKRLRSENEWVKNYLLNFEATEGLMHDSNILEESLSFDQYQILSGNSKIILDLPYEKQQGYTHRMIDALVQGKKVITTNSNIINESFYNPDQIYIIETEKPKLNKDWIMERNEFQFYEYLRKLELSEWLSSVINVRVA
jgi:hypothetical protein